jgi:maltodextrin utilization protein YvdJ
MSETSDPAPAAWLPLTPRGVAAFARATPGRLLLVQLIAGLLVCGSIIALAGRNFSPVISEATRRLPDKATLENGELNGLKAEILANGTLLAIVANPWQTENFGQTADFQIDLGKTNLQISGLLGSLVVSYPVNTSVTLDRSKAEPWWGAWRPMIVAGFGLSFLPLLFLCWMLLATLYFLPVKLWAFFADRHLSLGGAWRLSGAGLVPGALLMTAAIFLYGWQIIDLIRLGAFFILHLVVGWIYLALAPFALPKIAAAKAGSSNPFASDPPETDSAAPRTDSVA